MYVRFVVNEKLAFGSLAYFGGLPALSQRKFQIRRTVSFPHLEFIDES